MVINIKLPLKLDYLKVLTDDTGILQHSKYSIPNRKEGYTTDDNARALITCIKFLQLYNDSDIDRLVDTYLGFLFHMQKLDGRFHNLLSYNRTFFDNVGSEDCLGRALWACGYALFTGFPKRIKTISKEIFDKGLRHSSSLKSPRAIAYIILGLCDYYCAFPQDNIFRKIVSLTEKLLHRYKHSSDSDWIWFEPYLTYANARLSQALFRAYEIIGDDRCLQIAKDSFDFLNKVQIIDEKFVPIGNKGWYIKGGKRALYDQQPIEASCVVDTAIKAFYVTKEEKYERTANIAFEWFLGKNTKNVMVYDSKTGACYDGVTSHGLNLNRGAEATISFLLARLQLETLDN